MDSDRTSRVAVENFADLVGRTPNLARILIKGWRPTAEMGVGCTSEGGSASVFGCILRAPLRRLWDSKPNGPEQVTCQIFFTGRPM
jgi:hypothetical protein